MAKVIKMKSSKAGKKVNKIEYPSKEEAKLLLEKGETFGDALIGMLSLIATDYKGMGLAAIGLAKALASLKNVAKLTDVNIDSLFESELAHFEKRFDEFSKAETN
jgi:hypothetical protein